MITNLHDLYIHQLKDIFSAEDQILRAMPQMIDRVQNDELKESLVNHLKETESQKERAWKLLEQHGILTPDETCEATKGLIEESKHLLEDLTGDATDAGIIAACQRIEHYEIAAYGTAKEYARELGYDDDFKALETSSEEEGEANKKLTKLATGSFFSSNNGANEKAAA